MHYEKDTVSCFYVSDVSWHPGGGYGASEIMDEMSRRFPELIRSSKKLIIGYSDITVFHSAWTSAGLPSVHCSMSAAFTDLPKKNTAVEKQMLQGKDPPYGGQETV